METFHKEENLISKELDEFEESIANKVLYPMTIRN
jgi:hypothetical protein